MKPIATLSAAVVAAALLSPLPAAAQGARCKGSKQHYAGKCRYPDEIQKLKAQQQARREREAAAAAAEAAAEADRQACEQSRALDTAEGWKAYLDAQPEGSCREEAKARMAVHAQPPPGPVEPPAPAEPEPPTPPPLPPPDPAADHDGGGGAPILSYIGFGIAGAGVIVGSITGAMSLGKVSDLDEVCPERDTCGPDSQDDIDSMLTLAHISTASFAIAGAGAVLGVVGLFLSGDEPSEPSVDAGALRLVPRLGPTGAGIIGRF